MEKEQDLNTQNKDGFSEKDDKNIDQPQNEKQEPEIKFRCRMNFNVFWQ